MTNHEPIETSIDKSAGNLPQTEKQFLVGWYAAAGSLILVLVLRLFSLEYPALTDPTEGRYAYIGQQMFLSGDWLVPKLPMDGESLPYLGKPPLHFWGIASAFSIFGMDEWVARLPSFVALLVTIMCVQQFCTRVLRRPSGVELALVLISMALIYFFSGAVAIDLTLTAAVAAALTFFASGACSDKMSKKIFGLGFFLSLALGFLTKGPIMLALVGFPIVVQITVERSFRLLRWLPWISGPALFFAVVAPWFFLAERANPGFSRYFFVNENFLRFFVSEYGDRYGTGHRYPYGSVWWMFSVAMLPWTPVLAYALYRGRSTFSPSLIRISTGDPARWPVFLLSWMLSPVVIFTFARQIHPGYVLPGLPAAALLIVWLLERESKRDITFVDSFIGPWIFTGRLVALFSIVAFIVGFAGWARFDMVWIMIPSCLSGMALFLLPKIYLQRCREALAFFSVAAVVCYNGAISVSADEIDENSSAKSILRIIAERSYDKLPVVGVTGNSNFSTFFYSRAWQGELDRPIDIRHFGSLSEVNDKNSPPDILVRTERSRNSFNQMPANYEVMDSSGRWTWLHDSNTKLKDAADIAK